MRVSELQSDFRCQTRENGGIEYSTKKMQEFKDTALEILFQFPENDARSSLIEFVNYTITRVK
jgi:octaprenyl-diphosphate synthase